MCILRRSTYIYYVFVESDRLKRRVHDLSSLVQCTLDVNSVKEQFYAQIKLFFFV